MFKQRATRIAGLLRERLNVDTRIESGGFSEFSVLVDDQVVCRRTSILLPSEADILDAVSSHLNGVAGKQKAAAP